MKHTMILMIAPLAITVAPGAALARVPAPTAVEKSPDVKKADRRYCITDVFTGSRVPKKVCKTRAEWASQGVELDNPID